MSDTKAETQAKTNPFPFSDSNKRYHTYEFDLRRRFGKKAAKIPLDAGFGCPNIDGTCGTGGCIYCSARGSGDFALSPDLSLREQYDREYAALSGKWKTDLAIAYLQAHTNTYADVKVLRRVYLEILSFPHVVGLSIATRADCLSIEVLALLREISKMTVLTVELGLQTVHDRTAELIRRGHTFRDFLIGYENLRKECPDVSVCFHLIEGLPKESPDMMRETARQVALLHPDQVKIHCLYVLRGTEMEKIYLRGEYQPLTKEAYVDIVCDTIERLPPDTVIARLTGDAKRSELIAPTFTLCKKTLINEIDRALYRRMTFQGALF